VASSTVTKVLAAPARPLFVFHRDVATARKKLADGYTAVK
jgi:hypothetical protein